MSNLWIALVSYSTAEACELAVVEAPDVGAVEEAADVEADPD